MESKVEKTRKKTGGRVAGTPNKVTQEAREAVKALLRLSRRSAGVVRRYRLGAGAGHRRRCAGPGPGARRDDAEIGRAHV